MFVIIFIIIELFGDDFCDIVFTDERIECDLRLDFAGFGFISKFVRVIQYAVKMSWS